MNAYELTANFPPRKTSEIVSWRGLLEFEKTLFVMVNLMDIVMTSLLLNTGQFIETNPIANYVLAEWGFAGVTAFKLIVVSLVMLIANIIAIRRIRTSRRLLHFGTLLVGCVVAYSGVLMMIYLNWFSL